MPHARTIIAALRGGYDGLVAVTAKLSDDDLARPSAAGEWDVAAVLSHLGSGAEIGRAAVRAALDGQPNPGREFNLSVWDRWNAMSRREQAEGFVEANLVLTELYEGMDQDTLRDLRIDLGFLPAPVDVATAARMRLSELALHSWDVRATFDDHATLAPDATGALLGHTELLAWISKPDRLDGRRAVIAVNTTDPESAFTLRLAEQISVEPEVAEQPDGTLTLPAEAWLRLVAGRLGPRHTPVGTVATGAADLDLLRRVFPGY